MQDLPIPHVLVLGLGRSGLAMASWHAKAGFRVTVADTRENPPELSTLRMRWPLMRFVGGDFAAGLCTDDVQAVYCSPGLSPSMCAPVLQQAETREIPVLGELDVFTQALHNLQINYGYNPVILAVTGTNGKTTVTTLTAALVERLGRSVAVAGNIGPSLLDTLQERLDRDSLPEVWVLELSSFQLAYSQDFEPTAATVLNISQDHLDWHDGMPDYVAAKKRIFGRQALAVLNRDDVPVMDLLNGESAVGVLGKGGGKAEPRRVLTFGSGMPVRPGDFGLESVGGMLWLVRAHEGEAIQRKKKDVVNPLHIQRLMPADALRIRGRHNALNALAALALASCVESRLAPMLYGLREYAGEPHRLQSVGVIDDVEYFDDSKGTNVGATVAALEGLGPERKLVLILGGDGKGQDFLPLKSPIARFARAVVLIGRDGPLLREVLQGTGLPMLAAQNMAQAVKLAAQYAESGDAVLLSPACASLDMFKNYAERAEFFCAAVRDMAMNRGLELELR